MAIYKFKIWFEEYDDVQRVIEIKSTQTFEEMHLAIQDAIGFDKSQLASFYLSDDQWKKGAEITLEDMSGEEDGSKSIPTMRESRLCDVINDPHQKFIYVFDFMEMWTLHMELVGIDMKDNPKLKYPACTKTIGTAPKQYDKTARFGLVEDNEFDEITKNYLLKADDIPGEISDDGDETNGSSEDSEEGGGDEFDSQTFGDDDDAH